MKKIKFVLAAQSGWSTRYDRLVQNYGSQLNKTGPRNQFSLCFAGSASGIRSASHVITKLLGEIIPQLWYMPPIWDLKTRFAVNLKGAYKLSYSASNLEVNFGASPSDNHNGIKHKLEVGVVISERIIKSLFRDCAAPSEEVIHPSQWFFNQGSR